MSYSAVIFDVDGTLVDTNDGHIDAWRRAFASMGYDVGAERIRPEVGKGGDNLVPSIIGEEADARDGAELRKRDTEEFLATAKRLTFTLFPGAVELMDELLARELRTAIATSSKTEQIDQLMLSVGVDLRAHVHEVVTGDDAESTKPAPDLVEVAVAKLGLAAADCVMIGDTPHDGEACRQAGVAFIGVLCGGNSAEALRDAGAISVWLHPADILAHLDSVLRVAAPSR
ncbi:MAG: HAD family hydrolase [Gemmatimonadota bacterium]|nr:HAD family hydrolase [Gemmatimonadota bacterium]